MTVCNLITKLNVKQYKYMRLTRNCFATRLMDMKWMESLSASHLGQKYFLSNITYFEP